MRDRFNVLVWRLTGWVCPEWSRRDVDAMCRFWSALTEAERLMRAGRFYDAHDRISEAIR